MGLPWALASFSLRLPFPDQKTPNISYPRTPFLAKQFLPESQGITGPYEQQNRITSSSISFPAPAQSRVIYQKGFPLLLPQFSKV